MTGKQPQFRFSGSSGANFSMNACPIFALIDVATGEKFILSSGLKVSQVLSILLYGANPMHTIGNRYTSTTNTTRICSETVYSRNNRNAHAA